MAVQIKYQSRSVARDGSTTKTDLTFYGTMQEMLDLENEAFRDTLFGLPYQVNGSVVSTKMSQMEGDIWALAVQFTTAAVDVTFSGSPENNEYGEFSASLSTTQITMPLETHTNYRTHWNYFLCAGTPTPAPYSGTLPEWYLTTKGLSENNTMPYGDSVIFRWVKAVSELPVSENVNGKTIYWYVIRDPYIPDSKGNKHKTVEYYEYQCYTVTEAAKFRTAEEAGRTMQDILNKIGHPQNQFALTWGNWKCDSTSIQWDGKAWKMVLTWTHSGDYLGWNDTLYEYGGRQ